MTTDKRISVAKAACELGVPEPSIREAIKPLYDNWQTIKSIKLSHFNSIAQALKDLVEGKNEVEQLEVNSGPDSNQQNNDCDLQASVDSVPETLEVNSDPDSNQQNNDFDPNGDVDLEDAACDLTVSEPDDLVTQQAQQLKVSVLSTFSDIAIDLNRITSAIAYSAALQNFASFKEIHSTTFRHHAQEYVEEFADEYQQMLSDLEVKCSPKQFLREQGIFTIG